MKTSGNKH